MPTIDTAIIGAGQAGLALSHELAVQGRDHVLLEAGRIGERWRSQRPALTHLLTPAWMTRLPGSTHGWSDPDAYPTVAELVDFLDVYARSFDAPVREETRVLSVRSAGDGYLIQTDQGCWSARHVVVATGHAQAPHVPALAAGLGAGVTQLTPATYRGPRHLPDGGVLVVGASSTGVQIAEQVVRSGRDVVLAVGDHTRLPRRHRGMDVLWWLDAMGIFDTDVDQLGDLDRARRQPSWQLVGRPAGGDLDLGVLRRLGVRLAGRLVAADGSATRFAGDLEVTTRAADRRMARLLDRVDDHIATSGLEREVLPPARPAPLGPVDALGDLDLRTAGIRTIVWATGYRRSYPWLEVPVLDPAGDILQHRGVTPSPGLYTVGLRMQTVRSSSFIDGVRHDARSVASHLAGSPLPVASAPQGGRP